MSKIYDPAKPTKLPNLKVLDPAFIRTKEYEAFLKYVSETTGVASSKQLALIWPAICQGAMEWVVVRKKSIDLGFAILHPVPLRGNWKQILLAKFPTIGARIFGKSQRDREALLELSGFDTAMFDSKLLAFCGHRFIMWDLEVEPKRAWYRAMFRQEYYLFSALGSLSYTEYVAKRINDSRLKLLRLYFAFLKKVAYPCARVLQSRQGKRTYLASFVPKGSVRAVDYGNGAVNIVVERNKPGQQVETKIPQFSTAPGVPSVPSLEPGPIDLRALGLDVRIPD